MKKETQGKTDLYIASWLKSQSRDKVLVVQFTTPFILVYYVLLRQEQLKLKAYMSLRLAKVLVRFYLPRGRTLDY
jgi:hypothetical protein